MRGYIRVHKKYKKGALLLRHLQPLPAFRDMDGSEVLISEGLGKVGRFGVCEGGF